jgi:pimeloyl-ACP methyl ester carboxylesterase
LEFALRHPQRIRALALFNVCGGLPMLNPNLRAWASLRPSSSFSKSLHRQLIQTASHPSLRRFSAPLLYANGEPNLHPRLRQFVQEERRNKDLRGALDWLAMGLDSFNVFSQPRQKPASFPRLMLGWGSQNRTLAPAWAHKLRDWLQPDEFWLIENAGHMPMYEVPEEMNQRLEKFFKNV